MISFEDSYIGQLRKLVGNRKLLTPGARAIFQDEHGRILFLLRRDNHQWGLPGGFMETDETVYEALCREVKEETGLVVEAATLISIYSGPRFAGTNQFGNEQQLLVFQFRIDRWSGSLVRETNETLDAGFFTQSEVPKAYEFYSEALKDLHMFSGNLILK
mgnify:CR=1 FL=1